MKESGERDPRDGGSSALKAWQVLGRLVSAAVPGALSRQRAPILARQHAQS